MSAVCSITDEVGALEARSGDAGGGDRERRARRGFKRPPSTHVFCKRLRLEGPWGVVSYGDIVHRSHPAVRGREEWFTPTSIGVGLGPGLDEELAVRKTRVAEFKMRPTRPLAGRAISFLPPTPSSTKRVEYPCP